MRLLLILRAEDEAKRAVYEATQRRPGEISPQQAPQLLSDLMAKYRQHEAQTA